MQTQVAAERRRTLRECTEAIAAASRSTREHSTPTPADVLEHWAAEALARTAAAWGLAS